MEPLLAGEVSITGGSVAIVSGSIGVSGTSAVREFPSGVQYSVGTTQQEIKSDQFHYMKDRTDLYQVLGSQQAARCL